ncbi:alpha/beta hydrolase [Myxococcus sp. K38C18041901]|uniref:alpha/beta fold hydrolase n=1 Tax=Myxococcus guangdongensis TaxID=2906760 RepID=UPI0020A7021B|nr:alpha/beta fold hydrolase [Myxococcus guangdongensis]MCP3063737.1 alpha/beta hydrolase [Myxococcus guangdongensis]
MHRCLTVVVMSLALSSGCASSSRAAAPVAEAPCSGARLDIDGHGIWVNSQGTGSPAVVFESGFGNDSSVWASLEKQVREKGFRTFVYDRAGMGRSTLDASSGYSLDNDARILGTALARCGLEGPLVVVGHSYGGAIGLVLAETHRNVQGVVLLDAVVPGVWPPEEVEKNLIVMRGQYDEIRKQAPQLAQVAIPWAEAMPKTAQRLDALVLPESLPIIDIVAANGQNTPESTAIWRAAHERFAAASAKRTYILAEGSSHKVMNDKEPMVLEAIATLVGGAR